jgi:hypothetical protein
MYISLSEFPSKLHSLGLIYLTLLTGFALYKNEGEKKRKKMTFCD